MKTDNHRHTFINRTNRSKDSNLHTGIGCRVVLNIRKTRVKVLEIAIPHFSNLSILLLTARVQPFQPSFHPDSTHKQSITRLQSFGQLVRADANVFRVCLVHFVREQLPSPLRTTGWAHKSPRIATRTFPISSLRSLPSSRATFLFYNSYLKSSPALYTPFQVGQVTAVWQTTRNFIDFFASP